LEKINTEILIIGAGLTGLTIAYLLKKQNIDFTLVEARNRLGGRILTHSENDTAPQEMGATWFNSQHTFFKDFLDTLGIEFFEQYIGAHAIFEQEANTAPLLYKMPKNSDKSFRIKGGTFKLIEKLASFIDVKIIHLNQPVKSIRLENERLTINAEQQFICKKAISTLPPNLFVQHITTHPKLPKEVIDIAQQTQTWMGESIKVALSYSKPFWRGKNLSGTIFSNVGPIPEMYDHSNFEFNKYALMGFLNNNFANLKKAERLDLVLMQLSKYFGAQARNYLSYQEQVWKDEKHTYTAYENFVLPHQNNGHPIYKSSFLHNRLFLAGTETASQFGGYMEGAIRNAFEITESIISESTT